MHKAFLLKGFLQSLSQFAYTHLGIGDAISVIVQ